MPGTHLDRGSTSPQPKTCEPHHVASPTRAYGGSPEVASLAEILGTGFRDACPLELGREIVTDAGGVAGLNHLSAEAFRRPGPGDAKVAIVLAAVDVPTRMLRAEVSERHLLGRTATLAATSSPSTGTVARRLRRRFPSTA